MVVERTVMCDHSMQMILLMERNKGGGEFCLCKSGRREKYAF